MERHQLESATEWAVKTYGSARLADMRRTQRAVKIGSALARDPMGSLPKQMGEQAGTKAAYRFLESAQTSYEQLMEPHLQQTKAMMQLHHACERQAVVALQVHNGVVRRGTNFRLAALCIRNRYT